MFTTKMMDKVRQMIEAYLERWPKVIESTGGLPVGALPSGGDTGDGYTPAPHEHVEFYDARKIWSRPIDSVIPAEGDGLVWDGTKWALGVVGGGGAAFKAYLTADTELSPTTNVSSFGDERYDTANAYNHSTYIWTPAAGPVAFLARTRLSVNVDAVTAIVKNGTVGYIKYSGRYTHDGDAYTDFAWQDLANGTDYYEIAITGDEGTLIASDTYWSGISLSGGGGGGGVGPVPDPFVYLVDSDGEYLLDADGQFLYENEVA